MTFAHDTQMALAAAAALVNTDPEGGSGEDTLQTRDDLARFLDDQGWYGVRLGDAGELDAVRALRPSLRRLWHLDEQSLVARINEILVEARALPQLVDHDGLGWHVHAVPQHAPLDQRMAVEAAMAMIDVVRSGELDRLKTCAADDCEDVVVDLSRNRSRRFCEGGCGNRENVRAYRDRQRSDP
ncbi:RNA-binding protein [Marmoricola sp. Leaf446]|uniref:CGNR zinc finger domain-containing protein n=1 Tax=Marmoricola sp. Leaf446 TaxID=1736379 RepID=UPI000701B251|nr:CGNR zinc finger domain-containing protein [Marmoricola sp. Leaf446]KQT91134.1 RNA-binding protein [Marmoricola sp. Leaf446]